MLSIWGDYAENPEYENLRQKDPSLSSSQFHLKSAGWAYFE